MPERGSQIVHNEAVETPKGGNECATVPVFTVFVQGSSKIYLIYMISQVT